MNNKKTINELIESHVNFAKKIAFQRKRNLPLCVSLDEVLAAAYLGLTEAANRYKPEIGFRFTTFAYSRVQGAINDYLREIGRFKFEDYCELVQFEKNEIFDSLEELLGKQGSDIMHSYYVEKRSMKEIGKSYRLSEARISQIMKGRKQLSINLWKSRFL